MRQLRGETQLPAGTDHHNTKDNHERKATSPPDARPVDDLDPGPARAAEPGSAAASAERSELRDSDDNETPNYLLYPEDINASRRDSDNASRRNSGLAEVKGFNKSLVSLFALIFCAHLLKILFVKSLIA